MGGENALVIVIDESLLVDLKQFRKFSESIATIYPSLVLCDCITPISYLYLYKSISLAKNVNKYTMIMSLKSNILLKLT